MELLKNKYKLRSIVANEVITAKKNGKNCIELSVQDVLV